MPPNICHFRTKQDKIHCTYGFSQLGPYQLGPIDFGQLGPLADRMIGHLRGGECGPRWTVARWWTTSHTKNWKKKKNWMLKFYLFLSTFYLKKIKYSMLNYFFPPLFIIKYSMLNYFFSPLFICLFITWNSKMVFKTKKRTLYIYS